MTETAGKPPQMFKADRNIWCDTVSCLKYIIAMWTYVLSVCIVYAK